MRFQLGSFPVPHQHGAWAMFLIPAVMAVALGQSWGWSPLFLILAFVLIFLSHSPASRFIRRWRSRRVVELESMNWALLLGGSGVILAGVIFVFHQKWNALFFGIVVGTAFLIHLWMTLNREHMSVPGEIIGVFGLTASTPTMYLFLHGNLDARGWVLWMINFLYFTGSIFYIKLKVRIQTSMPEPDLKGKLKAGLPTLLYGLFVLTYVFVITVIRGYSWFFFWAYVPFFIKAVFGLFQWQDKRSLRVNRLGFIELMHSFVFAVVCTIGFYSDAG